MHLSRPILCGLLALAIAACSRDPLATRLPGGPSEIGSVQKQLDKLTADERQLVIDYIKRSNGDVLPAQFADPDAPLTARTFGEAIKLQRDFKVKFAAQEAQADQRKQNREDAFAPLRRALPIALVQREIQTVDQVYGRQPSPGQALNGRKVLVTTFRLTNYDNESITSAAGAVTIRSSADPKSLMGLTHCYIEHNTPIPGNMTADVRCANTHQTASPADEAFVSMPESELLMTWEPRKIVYSSGKKLESGL